MSTTRALPLATPELAADAPRLAAYLASKRPLPNSGVDQDGRLIPLDSHERAAQSEALARALDDIDAITDETDTDETWAAVFQGIDAGRPHRTLFEGPSRA
ncbi:MAG: hypothetical protein ABI353_19230 [Isosphaeraceae bacterium]